jgi:hypothetical protein
MIRFRSAMALLAFALLSETLGSATPNFSGLWVEVRPASGPFMRLRLTQAGSRVRVQASYRDSFSAGVFGDATIEDDRAIWTIPQSYVVQFRSPGYNYDDPGKNIFTLSLGQPIDGQLGPALYYIQETQWNARCGGHPIGIERIRKVLIRK